MPPKDEILPQIRGAQDLLTGLEQNLTEEKTPAARSAT